MNQDFTVRIAELAAQGKGDRAIRTALSAEGIQITRDRVRTELHKLAVARASQGLVPVNSGLPAYEVACRAIAEAKTFDDVRDWEDKAAAVREYSRRIHNREMELDAFEIRERARRRRGELIISLKEQGRIAEGRKLSANDDSLRITLESIDVTPDESSRDQKIARLDGNSFERLVARCRAYAAEHPEKHSFDVLRTPDQPINGARSVMAGRKEADDCLDFFPTPPWATRALIERALPQIPDVDFALKEQTVWEPASGEGHMAVPLAAYFNRVIASDIFDRGYGVVLDFLESATAHQADWIVTNPPFGEKTEAFVLRALDLAKVGVAMFVRLQWLETIGRYERLFKDRPPTLIAFFAERVNLCKGRWEPDGGTATAYIWLVWVKGRAPQAPFWIPPGQRDALTRPEDIERFTPHESEHPHSEAAE